MAGCFPAGPGNGFQWRTRSWLPTPIAVSAPRARVETLPWTEWYQNEKRFWGEQNTDGGNTIDVLRRTTRPNSTDTTDLAGVTGDTKFRISSEARNCGTNTTSSF